MNLNDREILELNELCGAVVDGTLNAAQRERLERWLQTSEAARRHYVRAMGLSASLQTYAAEMHAEGPDRPGMADARWRIAGWVGAALAAAAALTLLFWARGPEVSRRTSVTGTPVARLTAVRDVRWARPAEAPAPGGYLRAGQRLELEAGHAEITFDSGARVILAGATVLELNSAWDASLRRGALTANVPREAIGFRISNSAVEVVDLGTEFSMVANANGSADVFVLKGEVEAAPRAPGREEVILLRENESRRFETSGATSLIDAEPTRTRLSRSVEWQRLERVLNGVRWSFDETDGDRARGVVQRVPAGSYDAQLFGSGGGELAELRVEGRHGRALRFNGRTHAEFVYPGISDATQHTIAFWVRIPPDALLSDAYSMAAWYPASKKLGHRPVGINWNRDPAEGPVGVLRTDFAGGCAMGATSLRDGKWHHIAVCFAVGPEDDSPVQVKQYVDGRLESSGIVPGRTRGPAGQINRELIDRVWLGRRLKASAPQRQYFKGELDELVITDRGLEPAEIVHLMRTNELPATALAAGR